MCSLAFCFQASNAASKVPCRGRNTWRRLLRPYQVGQLLQLKILPLAEIERMFYIYPMHASQPETKIQKAIFAYLVRQNFLVIRVNSGGVTREYKGEERFVAFVRWQELGSPASTRGISDIIAFAPWGQLFVIECKALGKLAQTSESQGIFLEAAERRGAIAIIADNLEDVSAAVEDHRPRTWPLF